MSLSTVVKLTLAIPRRPCGPAQAPKVRRAASAAYAEGATTVAGASGSGPLALATAAWSTSMTGSVSSGTPREESGAHAIAACYDSVVSPLPGRVPLAG